MNNLEIKHRYTGAVLYKSESATTLAAALQEAIEANADLRGADLRYANLYGANLRGANLRDADLRGANLRDANLYGADLRYANLYGANLYDANLRYANLRDANLRDANLYNADLRYANLYDADLRGEKQTIAPVQILGLEWNVLISRKWMQIGCQVHLQSDWFTFDDERIEGMAPTALEFWQANKDSLKTLCDSHEKRSQKAEVTK